MDKKLKPCPFCGGKAEIFYNHTNKDFMVECGNMKCHAVVFTRHFNTEEAAIAAWNKRVKGKRSKL